MAFKKKEEQVLIQDSSFEKLRDELFNYRIEIQSYKRSMRMLIACVSVVVALLGFMGYDRTEC